MTLQTVSTIEIFPDERLTLEERVEKWCVQLCRALQASYDKQYDAGSYDMVIDGNNLSSGMYFIQLITEEGFKYAVDADRYLSR